MAGLRQSLDLGVLGESQSLQRVKLSECRSLTGLSGIARCKMLSELQIARCETVHHLNGLGQSKSLRKLNAGHCQNLRDISDLQHCTSLENLNISGCANVVEAHVNALGSCIALHTLHIHRSKVKNISDLRSKLPTLMVIRQ